MSDFVSLTPPKLAAAVAELVSECANIELMLNIIIWKLLDVPPLYGRPISARLDIRPKTEIILSLLERRKAQKERFKRYTTRIAPILKVRNDVVHGALLDLHEHSEMVTMLHARRENDDPRRIASHAVPLKEIHHAAKEAGTLGAELARFSLALKPLPKKPRKRSQKKKPSNHASRPGKTP